MLAREFVERVDAHEEAQGSRCFSIDENRAWVRPRFRLQFRERDRFEHELVFHAFLKAIDPGFLGRNNVAGNVRVLREGIGD
jgi:hypothetical protein